MCVHSELPFDEVAVLTDASAYLQATLDAASLTVYASDDASAPDQGKRASHAVPGNPSLFIADAKSDYTGN